MYKGEFTMKIAVCDDDRQVLLSVLSQLASYQEQRQTELSCQGFENAVDLLASIEHQNYDLLFLDVLMPGLNGLQAAREIRQKNDRIKIVFLTSSPEYAVESYSVQAIQLFVKAGYRRTTVPDFRSACRLAPKTGGVTYRTITKPRVSPALQKH